MPSLAGLLWKRFGPESFHADRKLFILKNITKPNAHWKWPVRSVGIAQESNGFFVKQKQIIVKKSYELEYFALSIWAVVPRLLTG